MMSLKMMTSPKYNVWKKNIDLDNLYGKFHTKQTKISIIRNGVRSCGTFCILFTKYSIVLY